MKDIFIFFQNNAFFMFIFFFFNFNELLYNNLVQNHKNKKKISI
jgi:hypothetical protein